MSETPAGAAAPKLVAVDATDAEVAMREFFAPKKPTWIEKEWNGKKYCLVRPQGSQIELIGSRASSSVSTMRGGKDPKQQTVFAFKQRTKEAWAVIYCVHVFEGVGAARGPGRPVFYKGGQTEVDRLLADPYEPDGILCTLGKPAIDLMDEVNTMEEVDAAKND